MNLVYLLLTLMLSYLLGSVATAVWAGKIFHGIDVREHGSGNAGATNVIRVLGWKTGIPVLLIDVLKGWAAAMLPVFLDLTGEGTALMTNYQILAGIAVVTGHIFPVFAGFRGGKGVATIFGVLLAIHPMVTLSCLGVFLCVMLITGYVSISSMSAGVAFPVFLMLFFDTPSVLFKVFSILVAIALIYTHRKNISRLLKGEETRLFKKKDTHPPTPSLLRKEGE
jgi:acyl phosphate:glycerol-3-phosphate acyltransferase